MLLDYSAVRKRITELAQVIDAPAVYLPTYERTEDFARPHIEIDDRGYHFVVVERGEELERRVTQDLDELLYWVFTGVTSVMASHWEANHRIDGQDFRRLMFQKELELIGYLSDEWREKRRAAIDEILARYPYSDDT